MIILLVFKLPSRLHWNNWGGIHDIRRCPLLRQQNRVDDLDHAVRLHDISNGNLRRAFAESDAGYQVLDVFDCGHDRPISLEDEK